MAPYGSLRGRLTLQVVLQVEHLEAVETEASEKEELLVDSEGLGMLFEPSGARPRAMLVKFKKCW